MSYEIKWNTLKKKAIEAALGFPQWSFGPAEMEMACTALIAGMVDGSFNWKRNIEEIKNEVADIIDRWDVRAARKLVDTFPGIVNKRWVGVTAECFYGENGEWMVRFG